MGLSTAASPAETAKHGYVGQLYDVTGLTLTAAPSPASVLSNLTYTVTVMNSGTSSSTLSALNPTGVGRSFSLGMNRSMLSFVTG